MIDAWLLNLFSNGFGGYTKTLEELDQMDLARLFRAREAQGYSEAWREWNDETQAKVTRSNMPKVFELLKLLEDNGKINT